MSRGIVLPRPDEVKILEAVMTLGHHHVFAQHRAAFALLFDTGLRPTPLLLANVEDRQGARAYVPWGKRKRSKTPEDAAERNRRARNNALTRLDFKGPRQVIYLSREALATWTWLEAGRREGPLIIGQSPDGHMTRATLYEMWTRACRAAGVLRDGKPPTLSSTRRTYANRARRDGIHVRVIQKLLGHVKLSSTEIYLEEDDAELAAAAELIGRRARAAI